MSDTTTKLTAVEVGRSLVITAPYGQFTVPPLNATKGGILLGRFVNMQVGHLPMAEEDQVDMFQSALGEELYEHLTGNYRLPEMTPIAQIALYWQTVGMEAVTAFLSGGPIAALKVLLAQMGVSQSRISPDLGSESQTLAPAVTQNISTPVGGKNASNKG